MTNSNPSDSPQVKQKVAQEVEISPTAAQDSENPEDPASDECEVPKTGDAPAD